MCARCININYYKTIRLHVLYFARNVGAVGAKRMNNFIYLYSYSRSVMARQLLLISENNIFVCVPYLRVYMRWRRPDVDIIFIERDKTTTNKKLFRENKSSSSTTQNTPLLFFCLSKQFLITAQIEFRKSVRFVWVTNYLKTIILPRKYLINVRNWNLFLFTSLTYFVCCRRIESN